MKRLVVVGGGILGTMHALEGVRRGYRVVHLERDLVPRGASVRNFGLVWVGGRASGLELSLALRARERWAEIARSFPGTGFRECGSLTVARSPGELAVLEEAAATPDADERGFKLLTPDEVPGLNPALRDPILAALYCSLDAAVEPRLVLGALRSQLAARGDYSWLPGRDVLELRPYGVRDQTGAWHDADLVVCCVGARSSGAVGEALAGAPVRRVRLQMLETRPYPGHVATALADGDSLRYYPAYRGDALARIEPQVPLASAWGAQLLVVQRLGGHLTIGDTHHYEEPFPFDLDDEPYAHLLGVAEELLGPLPGVDRRWSGVYSEVTVGGLLYHRSALADGVVVVTGPGGRGMTMSPAIAEQSFT